MNVSRLFLQLSIIMTTFNLYISELKSLEPFYNRREILVRLAKNSEKQAKTDERITFLTQCRKKSLIPKFISNAIKISMLFVICFEFIPP